MSRQAYVRSGVATVLRLLHYARSGRAGAFRDLIIGTATGVGAA